MLWLNSAYPVILNCKNPGAEKLSKTTPWPEATSEERLLLLLRGKIPGLLNCLLISGTMHFSINKVIHVFSKILNICIIFYQTFFLKFKYLKPLKLIKGFSPIGKIIKGLDLLDEIYSEYGEGGRGDGTDGKGPSQGIKISNSLILYTIYIDRY